MQVPLVRPGIQPFEQGLGVGVAQVVSLASVVGREGVAIVRDRPLLHIQPFPCPGPCPLRLYGVIAHGAGGAATARVGEAMTNDDEL